MPAQGSDNANASVALNAALGAVNVVNVVGSTSTGATLPDPSTAGSTTLTLTASGQTVTLPTPAAGKRCEVLVTQGGAGSMTVVWATPSGAIRWPGAAPPTLTTTTGHTDRLTFACLDGTNWVGHADLNVG